MVLFTPAKDIADLPGKVIFITGGKNGLGREAALQRAHHNPASICIGSRSKEKVNAAIAAIVAAVPKARLVLIQIDLESLSSVQAAAREFLASSSRLDILMNNTGIMAVPPQLSVDGYEIQFATNHLGHALLTRLLLPTMLKSACQPDSDVRVITHLRSPVIPRTALARYSRSKLANILYSKELAHRYPEIKAVAIHPGTARTGLNSTMGDTFLLAKIVVPIFNLINAVPIKQATLNQLWACY
ncbi:hypothetical protein OIDMADRAFT_46311 [Oidiodendron maius Zn]|uniref:Uncharacterized protein n=1 Tax=Oidiodendron maius (strain Zn) TaxID=913774 RepID=A0A0C3GSF5_OIDMZ|nr:hypothetical protein OIDMADRAFT_46311 [Oidiodendron maius Zn]